MRENDKMKVLYLGIRWPAESFISNLVKSLAAEKTRVRLSIAAASKKPGFSVFDNVRIIPLISDLQPIMPRMAVIMRMLFMRIFKNTKDLFAFWKRTAWMGSRRRRIKFFLYRLLPIIGNYYDIIHFHWNSAAIEYMPFFELFKANIIISCRGAQVYIAPNNPRRKEISKELLRESLGKADIIHCVSDGMKREILKYYAGREDRIYVIKPAVDTDFFFPNAEAKSGRSSSVKIVSVGSLIWRKGYEYTLISIEELIKKDCSITFDIVGGGPDKQRIFYTIFDLEIGKYVRILGQTNPTEIRQTLWDSDIFFLSSLSEGISNAVLEAMACGLPIVTTDCGGIREAISDGVEGFIVPIRQPWAAAEALEKLVRDNELRIHMGDAARKRVSDQFALNAQARKFIDLYQKTLNKNTR